MIYISPEKKFLGEMESLVKRQIDNSFNLGWKKEDIVLVTNFPYEYGGTKAIVVNDKINNADIIVYLLVNGIVKEAEIWWYHDLDVLQLKPMDSSQIDFGDTVAGFTDNGTDKLDTGNIFFRTDSEKLFEWMRNRAHRLRSDEATALSTLVDENYRNIGVLYKKIKLDEMFEHQK